MVEGRVSGLAHSDEVRALRGRVEGLAESSGRLDEEVRVVRGEGVLHRGEVKDLERRLGVGEEARSRMGDALGECERMVAEQGPEAKRRGQEWDAVVSGLVTRVEEMEQGWAGSQAGLASSMDALGGRVGKVEAAQQVMDGMPEKLGVRLDGVEGRVVSLESKQIDSEHGAMLEGLGEAMAVLEARVGKCADGAAVEATALEVAAVKKQVDADRASVQAIDEQMRRRGGQIETALASL